MPRDPKLWMWAEALSLLDQAEHLHRRFFLPCAAAARPVWEPPVDILETPENYRITVVLPGVGPENIEVSCEDRSLVVAGDKPQPHGHEITAIHCLEIPYGRFERRIALPHGRVTIGEPRYEYGCLTIVLNKAG